MLRRPSVLRSRPRDGLVVAVLIIVAVSGTPARAGGCSVTSSGEVTPAWQRALSEAQSVSAQLDDCAVVGLQVSSDGSADLAFATRDGRRARRWLRTPDELVPALQALGVSLPQPPSDGPDAPEQPGATTEPASSTPVPAASATPGRVSSRVSTRTTRPSIYDSPAEARAGVGLRLSLGLGARGGDFLLSPLLFAGVTLDYVAFQLAVSGSWEAQYFDLQDGGSSRDQSSALVLGLALGRRVSWLGAELSGAARVARAVVEPNTVEQFAGMPATNNGGAPFSQWRLGGSVAAAFPERERFRFRIEIGADVVVAQAYEDPAPLSPGWGLTGVFALERVLP